MTEGGSWNDMICDKNDPHDYAKTLKTYISRLDPVKYL